MILLAIGLVAIVGLIAMWRWLPDADRSRHADRWAASEGVALDPITRPVVDGYLRTSRHLRQIGFVGGIVVPPAITAGTGIDLGLPGLMWPLLGYLVGCLWAELALTRRPGSGPRTASLTPRRLADYLPRTMLVTQVVAAAVVVLVGLASAWALDDTATTGPRHAWTIDTPPDDLRRTAAVAAVVAALAMAGVLAAQRRIVRRPQPLRDPAHIAVDDALRSSSVRLLGTTGLAIVGVLAMAPVLWITWSLDDSGAGAVGTLALLILLTAFVQWRWWPHRGWRVRRHPTVAASALAVDGVPVPEGDRA